MFIQFEKVWVSPGDDRKEDVQSPLSTDEIKTNILSLTKRGCDSLCIDGEEPTLVDNISEILEFANHQNIERIKIVTNARYFKNDELVREYFKKGVFFFEVPLFGHNAGLHDTVTKERGSFKETLKGVRLIKQNKIEKEMIYKPFVQINLMLNRINYKHLFRMVKLCLKLNVDKIKIFPSVSEVSFSHIVKSIKKSMDYCVKNNCWIVITDVPPCLMQGYEYFISEFYEDKSVFQRKQIAVCNRCIYQKVCSGINIEYLAEFGEKEFLPVINSNIDIKSLLEFVCLD